MTDREQGVSKSWFCTFSNPEKHGYDGTPMEIVERVIAVWIENKPQRTCAVAYCISAEGLPHLHAVLEDTKAMRWTIVKDLYPSMNIQPTKGNKEQAEAYINKKGKYEEKGEQIIYTNRHGEIKGKQGQRRDLEIIEELIEQGKRPKEIMRMSFAYRRYDKMIRQAFYDKRDLETPWKREVNVTWHVGASGSGKSYVSNEIVNDYGEDALYMLSDYDNGGLDNYNGEKILFMDELRGQIKFNILLGMLEGYKKQAHARYTNIYMLWDEVHITSVLPPEEVYKNMVTENRALDNIEQLKRRINSVMYHYKENGEYKTYSQPMTEYKDYDTLKQLAHGENIWNGTTAQHPF